MQHDNGFGWTFDTAADEYDKYRPGYPEELYKTVFSYISISNGSRALEIGIGTGQATTPFLKAGCNVTAVEYGETLARRCREKFGSCHGFSVITGKFEDVSLPEGMYDLVYSATAFHWIPEDIGYPKVLGLLKSGGAFARFAARPCITEDNKQLAGEIEALYGRYYYPYYDRKPMKPEPFTEKQAGELAAIAGRYGFTDLRHELFRRVRSFTAKEYRALLMTYSDHIAMEESVREPFLDGIEKVIEQSGGIININDAIDLELARKP